MVRYATVLVALSLFAFAASASVHAGLSRLLSEYGSATDSLAATERAVRFNPADPEALYAHAVELADAGRSDEAVAEFERAALLRPNDYLIWQELGRAREDSGDTDGASRLCGRQLNSRHITHSRIGNWAICC